MIDRVVDARRHDAGLVRTALAVPIGLPKQPRGVGPFALVAHALPIDVAPGKLPPDFDVRPHPHIGPTSANAGAAGRDHARAPWRPTEQDVS